MPEAVVIPALRADARRNRDAILRAAREVFAESGVGAPLELVASRAGVGRATLYRRFPTRHDLVAAIFDADFEHLRDEVAAEPEPARSFFKILEATFALQQRNPAVLEIFTTRIIDESIVRQTAETFEALLSGPLAAAQRAGLVRHDLRVQDVGTLLLMMSAARRGSQRSNESEQTLARIWALMQDAIDPARAPRALPA